MKRAVVLFALGICLLALVYSTPLSIIIDYPGNTTISDSTPNLNGTTDDASNITYNWDGEGNISGCRDCREFNSTYGEALPDSSTVLLLHFNENRSNTTFDSSSFGNNGTLLGSFTPNNCCWVPGRFGSAVDFNPGYIEVPHSSSLVIPQNLTIIAWIRPRSNDLTQFWVTIAEKFNDEWGLYIHNGKVTMLTSALGNLRGATTPTADAWHCIAGVSDGDALIVYLDGQQDAISDPAGPPDVIASQGNSLRIGGNSGDNSFNGDMDELAIYNRSLSASEIQAFCSKSLNDGLHRVEVHAKNAGGNSISAVRYFTIDSQPPYRIDLNAPTNGSRQNSSVSLSWTSFDTGSNMSSNLTIDGVVNQSLVATSNGSATTVTVSGLGDGTHSWNITSWDNALNTNTSITKYFTVDSAPPAYTVFNNTPLTPNDAQNATCYSNWTDNIALGSAIVEENATGVLVNHTISIVDGWANYTIDAGILEAGMVRCRVIVNDSVGNTNSTPTWNFTVTDTTPPYFRSVTNLPSTSDDLDPGVQVNVSANVTDSTGVDTVILQYRQVNASDWSNITMNLSSGLYLGNFTANATNNWSYQIWANDTLGRSNASTNTTLSIDYDWSWTRIPATFGTKSGAKGTNIPLGNITINNTGDFVLFFEVNASQSWIYLNTSAGSLNFSVANKTTGRIVVNASLPPPPSSDEFTVEITLDAVNGSANPSSAITNATVVNFQPGAFLRVTIEQHDPTVAQGDNNVVLIAKVTNWGNNSANNTWLAWSLPSGWANSSALNTSTPTLQPESSGSKFTHTNTISVNITSSASTGTQLLTATSGSDNTNETNTSVSVTVSAAPSPAPTPSAAGGGAGVAPAATIITSEPVYSPTPEIRASIFQTTEALGVIKGTSGDIKVKVVNPIPNTTLENVTINISGYPAERILISPQMLSGIGYLEAGEFTVKIIAPKEEGTVYALQSILSGKILYLDYPTEVVRDTGQVMKRKNISVDMFEERSITLVVQDEILPILALTEEEERTILQTMGAIELLRGGKVVLPVKVGNPFPGTTLENLVLNVEGYPSERIDISPKFLSGIGHGEIGEFKVTITAPTFAEKGTFKLNITLGGELLYHDYPTIISELTGQPILKRDVSLGLIRRGLVDLALHEVSRAEASAALNKAAEAIEELEIAGLSVRRATRLLSEAKGFLAIGDYEDAKERGDAISTGRDAAMSSAALLKELERGIIEAEEEKGLSIHETKNLFNLGFAAFEREDYATALERFRNARDTLALETKGRINLGKILLDNLRAIIGGIVALAIAGYFGANYLVSLRTAGKMRALWSEESGIITQIMTLQTRYFKEKSLSFSEYRSAMEKHEDRLAGIEAERAALRARRPLAALIHRDIKGLRTEEREITNLMKDLQRKYFEEKSIGRKGYERAIATFKARIAEVEAGIAAVEAEMEMRRLGR